MDLLARWAFDASALCDGVGMPHNEDGGCLCGRRWLEGAVFGHLLQGRAPTSPDPGWMEVEHR